MKPWVQIPSTTKEQNKNFKERKDLFTKVTSLPRIVDGSQQQYAIAIVPVGYCVSLKSSVTVFLLMN